MNVQLMISNSGKFSTWVKLAGKILQSTLIDIFNSKKTMLIIRIDIRF
jgi:hypothetical protein